MAVLRTTNLGVTLPAHVASGVWKKAQSGSVLAKLSKQEPQKFGTVTHMKLTRAPRAEVVGESAQKSSDVPTFGSMTTVVRKVQVTQRFSQEVKWADEDYQLGVLTLMGDLAGTALGRSLDLIAIHGINPLTGAPLAGAPVKIADSTNTVTSGSNPAGEIEAAVGLVIADGITPNSLALDGQYGFKLATQKDAEGKLLNPTLGFGQDVSNYWGLSAAVGDTVRGVEAATPSKLQAIVGDFTSFSWGVQRDIGLTVIEAGDPDGQGDLARVNELALRAEVVYGIGIFDLNAFGLVKTP